MKNAKLALFISLTMLAATAALADGPNTNDKGECHQGKCDPPAPPKKVCLNVFCSYQKDGEHGKFEKCEAAAVFEKWVTAEGNEIWDNSAEPFNPDFEVSCDDRVLFNGTAHRYTDYLGTRIQALRGPYPALLLPRGVLQEGHRYEKSALEFPDGHSMRGYCFVYTGAQ
jgi:hypothetical protein